MLKKLFKKKEKSTFQNFSLADQLAPMVITEEEEYLNLKKKLEKEEMLLDIVASSD